MAEARHTVAVIITFRKSHQNSLERVVGVYRSSKQRNIRYILDVPDNRQFIPQTSTKYIKFVIKGIANVVR
jgi:ribulose bisphosphate carboxylase small subunit